MVRYIYSMNVENIVKWGLLQGKSTVGEQEFHPFGEYRLLVHEKKYSAHKHSV